MARDGLALTVSRVVQKSARMKNVTIFMAPVPNAVNLTLSAEWVREPAVVLFLYTEGEEKPFILT